MPADSVVLEGSAVVDESLLTGESAPVTKGAGDVVNAGTLVSDGSLISLVTEPVADSRLSRISGLIEQTLSAKPPVQRLVDRVSAYFALAVLGITVLTFAVRLLLDQPLSDSLVAAIAVLVVACPCALGLATPLALTVALGLATRLGMVVRNPAALEIGATIERMVFDKTGTITRGRMTVEKVVALGPAEADPDDETRTSEVLRTAAAVEQFSEHPVARAIVSAYKGPPTEAVAFESRPGLGASARLSDRGGERVLVGSPTHLNINPGTAATAYTERGSTVVWIGHALTAAQEGAADGFIVLRDEPNPTATQALRDLRRRGVRTVILSGDDPRTVRAIADEVGADEWAGGLSLEEKSLRIKRWQDSGESVAMAGDGVNDAPALAQADLALAMAEGTDLAGATADVLLTREDLTTVPGFLVLSSRTRRIIRENLSWAFAYNLVAVPLAVAGLISPIIAAAAMAASSVLVVGNSLRLRRNAAP